MTQVKFLKCDRCGVASNSTEYQYDDFYVMESKQLDIEGNKFMSGRAGMLIDGKTDSHHLCHDCYESYYTQQFLKKS